MRDGGALFMAEGPEFSTPDGLYYSPLGAISPAEPSGDDVEAPYRARVSEQGERHPVTRGLNGFDANNGTPNWGRWFRIVGARPTSGMSVMTGPDDRPLLVLSRVDKGRVGLLLSDQMWLWARGYDGGGPYLDLLRRLAHWLMKEPDLEEEALRASAKGREVTVERQSVSGAVRDTYLVAPDGKKTKLESTPYAPGLSRAHVNVSRYGLYRAEDGEHVALVNVGQENPLEFAEVTSTTDVLRPLAAATGGDVKRLGDASGVNMPSRRRNAFIRYVPRRRLDRPEDARGQRGARYRRAADLRRAAGPAASGRRAGRDVGQKRATDAAFWAREGR